MTKTKEIKSKVNIKKAKKDSIGYIIEISDNVIGTVCKLAVTKEELEMIVLYGGIILKEK